MKTWKCPELMELNISETAHNGFNVKNPDGVYTDQNKKGWLSLGSGGTPTGPDIIVKPAH
jgi:hypothetical protein